MKLNIDLATIRDRTRAMITDDRGEKMPCVRRVEVDHQFTGECEVRITLVVDGKSVKLGSPRE